MSALKDEDSRRQQPQEDPEDETRDPPFGYQAWSASRLNQGWVVRFQRIEDMGQGVAMSFLSLIALVTGLLFAWALASKWLAVGSLVVALLFGALAVVVLSNRPQLTLDPFRLTFRERLWFRRHEVNLPFSEIVGVEAQLDRVFLADSRWKAVVHLRDGQDAVLATFTGLDIRARMASEWLCSWLTRARAQVSPGSQRRPGASSPHDESSG